MPNRGSQQMYEKSYKWLLKTQGNRCLICNKPPPEGRKLQIDHIIYGEHIWDPENISLMCSACNLSLRHKTEEEHRFIVHFYRARNVRERERESECVFSVPPEPAHNIMEIVNFMHGPAEMQAKSHYEPLFAVFAWELINEYGSYPEKDMLDSFFYQTRCSQITSKRYLDGYCSAKGQLKRTKVKGEIIIEFKYPVLKKKKRPRRKKE